MGKSLWILIVILLSISHLFARKKKYVSLAFFPSHSLLLLSPFLLTSYNLDHEKNESESDKRKDTWV